MDVFRIVLPYLHSDRDRLVVITCCKAFRVLLKYVRFVKVYDYDKVKHLKYIKYINNVHYAARTQHYDSEDYEMDVYDDFISPSDDITMLTIYDHVMFDVHSFPSRLHYLDLQTRWRSSDSLCYILPKTLRILTINGFTHACNIPDTVITLTVGWVHKTIPPGVRYLTITRPDKPMDYIGKGVTHLYIRSIYAIKYLNIPVNVTHLTLDASMDHHTQISVPGVTHLTIIFPTRLDLRKIPNKVTHLDDFSECIHPGPHTIYVKYRDTVLTREQIDALR